MASSGNVDPVESRVRPSGHWGADAPTIMQMGRLKPECYSSDAEQGHTFSISGSTGIRTPAPGPCLILPPTLFTGRVVDSALGTPGRGWGGVVDSYTQR